MPTASLRTKACSPEEQLKQVLELAHARCKVHNVKFTPLREQVLSIICKSAVPMGAYEIMSELGRIANRDKVAPPTVYRSLDFLLELDLIHRIHSLNAYVSRNHKDAMDCAMLFICNQCKGVKEIPNSVIQQSINLLANEIKFRVEQQALEIHGLCLECKQVKKHAV